MHVILARGVAESKARKTENIVILSHLMRLYIFFTMVIENGFCLETKQKWLKFCVTRNYP